MPGFEFGAASANCANDGLGKVASETIAKKLAEKPCDFYTINCQEVDFNKAKGQLRDALDKKNLAHYEIKCFAQMPTHTKKSTQIRFGTGITSFIIYDKNKVEIKLDDKKEVRHSNWRVHGSAYNKGALIIDYTVTRIDNKDENIKVRAISAHLDSNHVLKRNHEWSLINQSAAKNVVTNWDDLKNACFNLVILGGDLNTRDKFINKQSVNMWKNPDLHPEMDAFYRTSFGNRFHTNERTYNHAKQDLQDEEDKNRPQESPYGSLDLITIFDGKPPIEKVNFTMDIVPTGDPTTARDHAVIFSPVETYNNPDSDFMVVQNYMASRLHYVAPTISKKIREMGNTPENQTELQDIYNKYLSTKGRLNQAIILHTKKLDCFNHLMNAPCVNENEELKEKIKKTLFVPLEWCEIDKPNEQIMELLLKSLKHCQSYSGIRAFLNYYEDLKVKVKVKVEVEKKTEIDIKEIEEIEGAFKVRGMYAYFSLCNKFRQAVDDFENEIRPELKEAANNILVQLKTIAEDRVALQGLSLKRSNILMCIAEESYNAYMIMKSNETVTLPNLTNRLENLSQEARGSSSLLWRALAAALDVFVRFISLIENLDEEHSSLEIVQDKRLADAVAEYKAVLDKIKPQDQENLESDEKLNIHPLQRSVIKV